MESSVLQDEISDNPFNPDCLNRLEKFTQFSLHFFNTSILVLNFDPCSFTKASFGVATDGSGDKVKCNKLLLINSFLMLFIKIAVLVGGWGPNDDQKVQILNLKTMTW